ncbi:adenylate kinase 7-like isoform X2 [Symsagittifera roscoffensis]|uniref:adenylate kinase 7-like isoform X2 n=1 Tax=Symsagittifera roscoffensis TaxID=84072 RepID=UPI00307C0C37
MSEEGEVANKGPTKVVKRIFINNLDSFHGKNISKFLSNCVVGASQEEGGEEEDAESVDSDTPVVTKEGTYQVIGTMMNPQAPKPDWVKYVLDSGDRAQLLEHLVECDMVIYDITEDPNSVDEAAWAIESMEAELEHWIGQKLFILVSSVLTWAKSKPLDPEDPEIPFTEDDYRRRKPHPNFKNHISCEKTVIKCGKTNKQQLISYVVAAGMTYGMEESVFHFLFKSAWHGQVDALQCYGTGENILPTIHVKDLAAVLQNILDSRPKTRYLVAVDDSQLSLMEIVKAVSVALHNGKVRCVSREDALLLKDLEDNKRPSPQADFDHLLVNLRMDAVYIKESMNINWVSEAGIAESIGALVKEFKETRKLQPIRVCLLGPPAVGKSFIAEKLCKFYKIHHIKIKDVIEDAIKNLERSAARIDAPEEEEEDDGKAQEDSELLEKINENKQENDGRIDDEFVVQFFKEKLHSKPCQNQGFVLDGYPKTYDQAKALFVPEDDIEELEQESKIPQFDKQIMPEVLVSLEAPDEFLRDRVMNLPEKLIEGTHNTEDKLNKRLTVYRENNTEDVTALNYFDELEVHPHIIDITKDKSKEAENTVEQLKKMIGSTRNYGATAEELAEQERQQAERRLREETMEREQRQRQEQEELHEMKRRQEEWKSRLDEVRREEQETLETQSAPLRNYLMQHVMPTLTMALVDCCKARPDDAVDFIAEYLFRNNPQVD